MYDAADDPLSGTIIRPTLGNLNVAMITLLFTGGGLFLFVPVIKVGTSQGTVVVVCWAAFCVASIVTPYFMIWRYRVVIGSTTIADARSRRRPKQVVPLEVVASIRWVKEAPLLLDSEGRPVMRIEVFIARFQAKKIAAMLDVPFVG